MTTDNTLSDAIDQFKAAEGPALSGDVNAILHLLTDDISVLSAWTKLAARGIVDPIRVFSIIVECRNLAPSNKDAPGLRKRDLAHYEDLRRAVDLLAAHYSKTPMLAFSDDRVSRHLHEHNKGVLLSRRALDWMQIDIDRGAHSIARVYENTYPSSQKRNQGDAEQMAFKTMLSFNLKFFSATISTTLWPRSVPLYILEMSQSALNLYVRLDPESERGLAQPKRTRTTGRF